MLVVKRKEKNPSNVHVTLSRILVAKSCFSLDLERGRCLLGWENYYTEPATFGHLDELKVKFWINLNVNILNKQAISSFIKQ